MLRLHTRSTESGSGAQQSNNLSRWCWWVLNLRDPTIQTLVPINFWSSLESRFRKGENIVAPGSHVRALNGGAEVMELRYQDYWKQIIKESCILHLLPAKCSTRGFPIHSLLRKFRINFHSIDSVNFPRRSRLKKDHAQDHRISYWQGLNVSPCLPDCKWPSTLPHQKFNISSPEGSHRAPWAAVSVILIFFLPDSCQAFVNDVQILGPASMEALWSHFLLGPLTLWEKWSYIVNQVLS